MRRPPKRPGRNFQRVFQQRQMPEEMPEVNIGYPATIVEMLRAAGFAGSSNEARRLVEQGGVRIDGRTGRGHRRRTLVRQPDCSPGWPASVRAPDSGRLTWRPATTDLP
ncbi:MAG: S4 domain-containing protein [Thermomicrobiales bacterium]